MRLFSPHALSFSAGLFLSREFGWSRGRLAIALGRDTLPAAASGVWVLAGDSAGWAEEDRDGLGPYADLGLAATLISIYIDR